MAVPSSFRRAPALDYCNIAAETFLPTRVYGGFPVRENLSEGSVLVIEFP
jgi:hypothetical protein